MFELLDCLKNHLCDSVFILNCEFLTNDCEYDRCTEVKNEDEFRIGSGNILFVKYWKRGWTGPTLFPRSQMDKN